MDSTPENTRLSPAEYERQKTTEARVEDIAYTINHSLVCSVVDVVGTPIANWTEKKMGVRLGLPGHDHSHKVWSWSWFFGEVIGDYVAVPVTVAFQRFAPGFMNGLRGLMEPVLGPLFRMGARRSAHNWAAKHGFATDSPEAKERERQIYEHEVRHLPQALIWTVSSTGLNIATQYAIERTHWFGHAHTHMPLGQWLWGKGAGKLVSSAVTAGVVVGFRGITPSTAERWDRWTSKNVFLPLTESIGHLFGVKKEDVERMHKRQEAIEKGEIIKQAKWDGRLSAEPDTSRTAG